MSSMRKVSQTISSAGNGDCLAACIASILECSLDRLPNPCGDNWWSEWTKFLAGHGLRILGKGRSLYYWDSYWIGVVASLNFEGRNHAVVMYDNRLVHDPNISSAKRYTELNYRDCVDGYSLILSDTGLFRKSNLWDQQLTGR